MYCLHSGRALSVLSLVLLVGSAAAGPMLVRVAAHDYPELYSHITFKGTSIEIAGAKPGQSYDLLLDRSDFGVVQASGLPVTVIHDDMDALRLEAAQLGSYHSYDQLLVMMRDWSEDYSSICRLESIGPTYLGNWIYGVKIASASAEGKPECLELGVVHAREWGAIEATRHFADTLIRFYATDTGFHSFIDNHQLYVFMVTNVDGYKYDYPGQLWQRKDRQLFASDTGCDPNRDFNGACMGSVMDDWGSLVNATVSSHNPRDEVFMGGHGAWAMEINAVSEWFKQHTVVACVSMHTYSELVLWPFGTGTLAPDSAYLRTLATGMASRMGALGGGTYTPEQSNYLYPTNCGSDDWFYGWGRNVGGFPCMSFTTELGTDFYQPTADLDSIQNASFRGNYYLFRQSDSIVDALEGKVPRPILAVMDSSPGDFTIHWTPVRPEHNHPDRWELEELSGLTVVEDNMESGVSKWNVQGASQSTTQKHGGTYSISLGNGNNIANHCVTKDPYPVQSGDSLKYWIWYNTENRYDVTVAEVSLEGKEWIQLHDRFTGNSSGWLYKAFPLEPWVGKSVFIRFRYMTDDGTTGSGVYIDDVWPVPEFANHTVISDSITDTLYSMSLDSVGTYYYRVRGHNATWGWNDQGPLEDIVVTGTGVAQEPTGKLVTSIFKVGPNPVTTGAQVSYALERAGTANLDVYDATGRQVRTLASGMHKAGSCTVAWDAKDMAGRSVPAGVYYVRLSADKTSTARMTVVR
ncbi:MAG: M14 family zinc carboxypeptidase [candidate division WOR-3 bacterium]|nr:M14 family zinc carboxypeptidase [candidate division WOR-3 bacterium]